MRSIKSTIKGILAMRRPYPTDRLKPKWGMCRFENLGASDPRPGNWWLHYWTPIWHEGRGPYVSIGLGWFAIYRGY